MKWIRIAFLLLILGCLIAIWFLNHQDLETKKISQPSQTTLLDRAPSQHRVREARPSTPFFGESLLNGYGQGSPESDLRKMYALTQNYRLLAKGLDARHFASNADVAAAFRGEHTIALQALPTTHSIFNNEGLIVDRWGNPLFFHLESAQKISLYSSGLDGVLGTEDDYSLVSGSASQGIAQF